MRTSTRIPTTIKNAFCVFLRRFLSGSLDSAGFFFPREIVTLRFDTGTDTTGACARGRCMSIERAGREEVVFAGSLALERALGAMSQDFFADIWDKRFRDADGAIRLLVVLDYGNEYARRRNRRRVERVREAHRAFSIAVANV